MSSGALGLAQSQSSGLLPFQGRLADASGKPIPDGVRVVQFQIYGEPIGGNVLWAGEVHRATINGGLVNVVLGSKNPLPRNRSDQTDKSFFDQLLYLQITVDSNRDGAITNDKADPPILPRQTILPVLFAEESGNARRLAGYDWSVLFGATSPAAGKISGSRIASTTITADQLAPESIDISRLAKAVVEALNPPGTIQAFAGPKIPVGWLLCDGSALDRDTPEYARLYGAIFESWGNGSQVPLGALRSAVLTGDNKTDFNIPDLRGYFLRGVSGVSARDLDRDSRTSISAGGNTNNAVGSIQASRTGQHTHGGDTGAGNGNLTALVYNSNNGNNWIRHRTIEEWTANVNGTLGELSRSFATGTTLGAVVVGRTSVNNPDTAESRPANAYVHYIIKL